MPPIVRTTIDRISVHVNYIDDGTRLALANDATELSESLMKLQLSSNVVDGICTIFGPQASFVLNDTGHSNVMINVALSDGTHVQFQNCAGAKALSSPVLPPGKYACMAPWSQPPPTAPSGRLTRALSRILVEDEITSQECVS
jgi:hypothetical protein